MPETSPSIVVREWVSGDETRWDAYVSRHPRATFFHQSGWKRVLERTFRYRAYYLIAERDGAICGALPLFACRSIRGKLSLYSLPHTVYGGPVGDDQEAEQALVDEARRLGSALGARSIELRNRHQNLLDLPITEGCLTFEKELPEDPELVRKTFPKKAREAINQATKRHKLEADFAGDLDTFYDLLAASYKSLGTPVFPKRFFGAMLAEFPATSSVLVVRHEGRPVSSVLSLVFRDTILPMYSGEAVGVKNLKSGNFKYFRIMQDAITRGLRRFDFGRSRANNPGVVKFKTNQGFEPEVLPYQIIELVPGSGGMSNPNTGMFVKLRRMWTKLPPSLARVLGPRIVKYFP